MSRLAIIAIAIVCTLGCNQQSKNDRVLARVGDEVLTESQARAAIDTSTTPYDAQVRNYVSSWVITELLYQEAMKQGVEESDKFQQQLSTVRKQLAIQSYLQTGIYSDTGSVTDDSLKSYFDRHSNEFVVTDDLIKLNIIGFTTREPANLFAGKVTRGAAWDTTYKQLLNDPGNAQDIAFVSAGKYYSQHTLILPELWKVAQTLGINDVSFPIRTATGYYVIQALAAVRSGSNPEFEAVREEVRIRFLKELQQRKYDSLIGTLQQRNSVELLLPAASHNDTSGQLNHD